jgi:hypothetical protein
MGPGAKMIGQSFNSALTTGQTLCIGVRFGQNFFAQSLTPCE